MIFPQHPDQSSVSRRERRERAKRARRRGVFAAIASVTTAALLMLGLPTMAAAEEPVVDTLSATSTEATEPAAEPAADPAPTESTPPVEEPVVEEPVVEEPMVEDVPPADDPTVVTEDEVVEKKVVEEEGLEQDAPALQQRSLTTTDVQPLATTNASITVHKGGIRSGNNVNGVAGVTFAAFAGSSSNPPSGPQVASCVTDGSGDCTMGVNNSSTGYWVVEQTPVPSPWEKIDSIATGNYQNTKTVTPNRFHTGNVTVGANVQLPAGDRHWANRYENPDFPTVCGLDIAIVVDNSASIDSGEMADFRAAINLFVGPNGLGNTPSRAAVYRFGTTASKVGGLLNMGSAQLTTNINTATPNGGGPSDAYTNWDAAMRLVANDSEQYDLVLFLTDGDPTAYGSSGGSTDTNVPLRMTEEAVFSANAVKAEGAKIVAVGVGLTTNSYLNLQAVAGPTPNDDYFLASSFTNLRDKLQEIATKNCGGTLTVQKQIVNGSGTVIDDTPAGWKFTVDGSPTNAATQTTDDATGSVNFAYDFSSVTTKTITVTEEVQEGYEMLTTPTCTVNGSNRPPSSITANSFKIEVKRNEIVSCTVQNRNQGATVEVDKIWVVKNQAGDTLYTGPNPAASGYAGFSAALTLNPAPSNPPVAFDTVHTGYTGGPNGSVVTIGETVQPLPPGCTATPAVYAKVAGANVDASSGVTDKLAVGANTYTITNTVTCATTLKLTKVVQNGTAAAADWKLTAGPVSGVSGVSGQVKPGESYSLTEASQPGKEAVTSVYEQVGWECNVDGGTFAAVPNATVSVQIGHTVECMVTNRTAGVTLKKVVQSLDGVSVPVTTWDLVAKPTPTDGLATHTVKDGTKVWVLPGHTYDLSETGGPAGWQQVSIKCNTGPNGAYQDATSFTAAGGTEGTICVFTNKPTPPQIKLTKKVVGADVEPTNWSLSATRDDTGATVVAPVAGGTPGYVDVVAGQALTLHESTTLENANQFLDGTWSCKLNGGSAMAGPNVDPLKPGDKLDCTVTNTLKPVVPTITKSVVGTPVANANGSWTISYDIVVTNPGAFNAISYQLEDELDFGSQVTVNSATYRLLPDGVIQNFTELDGDPQAFTGEPSLAPNSSHIWRVVVQATVAPGANFGGTNLAQCDSDTRKPGTVGFLNVATLKANDETYSDEACAVPVKPTFAKSPAVENPVVDNGDGTFTLNYTLTVGNPSATTGVVYDLSDTLDLPAGTTVQSVSVNGPGTLNPAWTGIAPNTQIANDVSLAGGDPAHVYTVSVVVQFTANSGGFTCPTNGLRNLGEVVSGNQTLDDDACIEFTPPKITHTKAVQTAAVQAADGSWSITYRITVTNDSTTGGVYTLSDTPNFGTGVNLPGVGGYTVTEVDNPGFTTPWAGSGVILSNRYLPGTGGAPGANVNTFDVTITGITLAGPTLTPQQTACPNDTGKGAFNNVSSLLTGGVTTQQHACDFPSAPTVIKSGATASQQPDASWNVSYVVTVSNTANGAKPSYYSLSDTPAFASGVVYKTVSVNGGAAQPYAGGPVPLATNQPIAAGATQQYVIVFNVDVPSGAVSTDSLKCTENGTPGKGFLNTATVTSGAIVDDDWDCTSVNEGGTPTVDKHDATAVQGADGVWTITYTVTVTGNAQYVSTYTLSDTLRFGPEVDIVSAAWSRTSGTPAANGTWANPSTTPTTALVSSPRVIGIDAVDEYSVTVKATVPPAAFDVPTTNTCQPTDKTPNVGFLNEAVMVSGQTTKRDTDCATPAEPEITKTKVGDSAVWDDAEDAWKATYTVTVHNLHATQALVYDLDDTPDFTDAVTITDATVSSADVTVNPSWNGDDVTRIVTDQNLPGNATHTFTVTVWFTVDADVEANDPSLLCEGDDEARGLLNGVTATSGGTWSDEDCLDVPVTVIVDKQWVINGGDPIAWDSDELPAGFTAQGTLDDADVAWGAASGPYTLGDEVDVDERNVVIPATCDLVDQKRNGTGKFTLTKTVNEYTVTNSVECIQTVTLDKVVHNDHGGDADASDWTLSASSPEDGFAGPDSPIAGVGVSGPVDLNVGYTLNEVANDTATANGYEVYQTWHCTSDTPDAFTLDSTRGSRSAMLTVTVLGADVDCWIENIDIAPKLTLVKVVEPDTISEDFGPGLWNLFAEDGGTRVLEGEGTASGEVDSNTTYTLGEEADFDGMEEFEASVWNCAPTGGGAPIALDDGEITLQPGDDVTCTITNTAKPATYTFDKQVFSTVQNPDGTWTIVYTIDVVNTSKVSPTEYDLTDSLALFGEGIEIDSAGWDGPDAGSAADGEWTQPVDENLEATLATDEPLPANTTHRYTVTVNATVTAAAWTAEGDEAVPAECTEGDTIGEGGFRNQATLTVDDLPTVDTDCDEPARTTAEKNVVGTPTRDNDPESDSFGLWTIVYDITVSNASGKDLFYDLSDTLGFPEGVDIVDATATADPAYDVSGWDGVDATVLADDREIEAAGDGATVHTYTITVIADVDEITTIDDVQCVRETSGHGFFNGAELANGPVITELSDCADIEVGRLLLLKSVDNSAFTELAEEIGWTPPEEGLLEAGDWNLLRTYLGDTFGTPGDAGIVFTVPVGDYDLAEQINAGHADHPLLAYYLAQAWSCDDELTDDSVGTVFLGELTSCALVNVGETSDVGIVKEPLLPDGVEAVDVGDEFDYRLTVTNHGSTPIGELDVIDDIDPQLAITGPATFAGPGTWTESTVDNAFAAHGVGPFEPDAVVTITIPVVMLPTEPVEPPDVVGPDDPAPTPTPIDLTDIPNQACVAITEPPVDTPSLAAVQVPYYADLYEPDDCDTAEVPKKAIDPGVYVRCINDVPWLYYDVQVSEGVAPAEITVTWTSADGSLTKVDTIPWDARSGRLLWPGAAVDANGVPTAYPGWRPITEADLLNPGSVVPGTRFLDLILDETVPTYPWRDMDNPATITFSINPSQSVLAVYPQALPSCALDRPPAIEIEKTASVTTTTPGADFSYSLNVTSTGIGAADPVTLFDEIPSHLRVDSITTAGAPAFPRWENCQVTGKDAQGYGGTLRCDLNGVLGPNFTSAPEVMLGVHVRTGTTVGSIVNVGEVCWNEVLPDGSSDPQVVCAEDDVTVGLPRIASTGFGDGVLWYAGLLIMLGGLVVTIAAIRRRNGGTVG